MKKPLELPQIKLIAIAAENGTCFLEHSISTIAEKTGMTYDEVYEQYIIQTAKLVKTMYEIYLKSL